MTPANTGYYVIAEGPDKGFVLKVRQTDERPFDGCLFVDGEWKPYDATLDVLFDHIDSIRISEGEAQRLIGLAQSEG